MDWIKSDEARVDDLGRDEELAVQLRSLDASQGDPSYWVRFRNWVMTDAASELARRRLAVELTVEDLLESWSRAVIPVAMAAAVATITLMQSPQADDTKVSAAIGVEELLVREIPAETQPVFLSPDATAGIVAFASDIY
jgi:hypothetical protein